jgi:hypothetical protein
MPRPVDKRMLLLVAALIAWSITSTWVAASLQMTASHLDQRPTDLKAEYEERVKDLTRRLVSIASASVQEMLDLDVCIENRDPTARLSCYDSAIRRMPRNRTAPSPKQ